MGVFPKFWKLRQSQRKPSIPHCLSVPVLPVCGGRVEGLTTMVNLVIPYCKMSWCLTGVKPTAHHWDTDQCSFKGSKLILRTSKAQFSVDLA